MNLFYQKIVLCASVFLFYGLIVVLFVVLPSFWCNKYDIFELELSRPGYCSFLQYSTIFYWILLVIVFLLILYASIWISFKKVKVEERCEESSIVVFIPCYTESKEELLNTIESVTNTEYSSGRKSFFIVVDGNVIGLNNSATTAQYAKEILEVNQPIWLCNDYSVYQGWYKNVFYTLLIKSRNRGKKDSFVLLQKILGKHDEIRETVCVNITSDNQMLTTFDLMCERILMNSNVNKDYILMLDTDTQIEPKSLKVLSTYLDENELCMAVCGETLLTNARMNFITVSQAFEYWITHKSLKAMEACYGEVLVLSGCFTLYRKDVICKQNVINRYVYEDDANLYVANLTKLGEDRLLTNILLQEYPDFTTDYLEQAKCYTDCPENLTTLLSQRRRWTNSLIFCHVLLLMQPPKYKFWKKLCFYIVVMFELALVLILPLLLILAYYYMIIFIIILANVPDMYIVLIPLIITLLCFTMPFWMSLILCSPINMYRSIYFIFTIPFYSILIPLYSLGKSDNVKWGSTRKTNEN